MTMIATTKTLMLAIILSLGTASCDKPDTPRKQNKVSIDLDPVLSKLNTFVAIMDLQLRTSAYSNCQMAEQFQTIKADNDFIREMIETAKASCELYRRYVAATRPTFDVIRAKQRLLDYQYAFSIYEVGNNSDGGYTATEIGLFSDLVACRAMESATRERDIPTRKCYLWQDPIEKLKSRS